MPQLDDPHSFVGRQLVDGGLVVIEQDHVGEGQQPGQPQPIAQAAPGPDARFEDGPQPIFPMEPALHHAVVHDSQVAAERLS